VEAAGVAAVDGGGQTVTTIRTAAGRPMRVQRRLRLTSLPHHPLLLLLLSPPLLPPLSTLRRRCLVPRRLTFR